MPADFPEGFRPCYTCRLTQEYPDLCEMCEGILERWETEQEESPPDEPPCTCNSPGGYCDCPGANPPSIWSR